MSEDEKVTGNAVVIGRIDEDTEPMNIRYGMVVEFQSKEDLKKAIADNDFELTVLGS